MARPKPTILLEAVNKQTLSSEQVLSCSGLFIVCYDGKPFNLRSIKKMPGGGGPKYKKVTFATKASANNLAKRLNKMFDTDRFHVVTFGI